MEEPFTEDITDNSLVPETLLYLVETDMIVRCDDIAEEYRGLTLNVLSENYIGERLKSSGLISVSLEESDKLLDPVEAIFGKDITEGTIMLEGGFDGTMEKVNAGTFIGEDKGPGRRTGIQSFLENDKVSIMAVRELQYLRLWFHLFHTVKTWGTGLPYLICQRSLRS